MDMVGAILVLVLTPCLWVLSHKYFRFIYFGNIGTSILKELLECFFIALLLVSILFLIGGTLLEYLGVVLLFLLKVSLWIGGIGAVGFGIYKLIQMIMKKGGEK